MPWLRRLGFSSRVEQNCLLEDGQAFHRGPRWIPFTKPRHRIDAMGAIDLDVVFFIVLSFKKKKKPQAFIVIAFLAI